MENSQIKYTAEEVLQRLQDLSSDESGGEMEKDDQIVGEHTADGDLLYSSDSSCDSEEPQPLRKCLCVSDAAYTEMASSIQAQPTLVEIEPSDEQRGTHVTIFLRANI